MESLLGKHGSLASARGREGRATGLSLEERNERRILPRLRRSFLSTSER